MAQLIKDGGVDILLAAAGYGASKIAPKADKIIKNINDKGNQAINATVELLEAANKQLAKFAEYIDEIKRANDEMFTPQMAMAGADDIPITNSKPVKTIEAELPVQVSKPERTEPSLDPDAAREPRGIPEKMPTSGDPRSHRGMFKQEDTANLLAQNGYDVELQPRQTPKDLTKEPSLNPDKNPDFRIEGKIFDNLAIKEHPLANPSNLAKNVHGKIEVKVGGGQTTRLVLNLDESKVDLSQLRQMLLDNPIPNLNEIIIVRNGAITHFFPFE